jgi:hypothetical protein
MTIERGASACHGERLARIVPATVCGTGPLKHTLVLALNLSALLRRRCGANGGCALYTPLVRPCGTSASLPVGVAGDAAGTRRSGEVLQNMQPAAYTATRDLNGHLQSSPIRRTQHNTLCNTQHAPRANAMGGRRRPAAGAEAALSNDRSAGAAHAPACLTAAGLV